MSVKNLIPSQLHDSVKNRITIVNADGTAYKDIISATASDNSKEAALYSLSITSDDTVSRDFRISIYDGTNDIEQADITVVAASGFGVNTPPIQIIANRAAPALSRIVKDIRGNYYMPLAPGETLRIKALIAVTAAKTIGISVFGYNYTRT